MAWHSSLFLLRFVIDSAFLTIPVRVFILIDMAFRFLHTADLHLGKVFHEHSLLEEQTFMLDQLVEVLADSSYRALVISGDVYDRSIPSPGAVDLFSGFLGKLKTRRPDLEVMILPGNHDSASRLGFGRELFAELGIHLITDPADADKPVIVRDNNRNTACAFFLLPFLYPGSLSVENPAGEEAPGGEAAQFPRSQARLAEEAASRLDAARQKALEAGAGRAVLAAHLFIAGGMESDSERVFLGSAERVDAGLFSSFDYVALGHLHRCQKAGKNCWYSGSPLAYSFGEAETAEKCFLSVDLGNTVTVTPVPVKPLRRMRRLRGNFSLFFRDASDPSLKEAENDYLEIILTDSSFVENPLPLLRRRFPRILSVRQDEALASLRGNFSRENSPSDAADPEREHRSPVEDFEDFLADIYGVHETPHGLSEAPGREALMREENREKISLFRELLAEVETDSAL
jgi:exonuclease SbcD